MIDINIANIMRLRDIIRHNQVLEPVGCEVLTDFVKAQNSINEIDKKAEEIIKELNQFKKGDETPEEKIDFEEKKYTNALTEILRFIIYVHRSSTVFYDHTGHIGAANFISAPYPHDKVREIVSKVEKLPQRVFVVHTVENPYEPIVIRLNHATTQGLFQIDIAPLDAFNKRVIRIYYNGAGALQWKLIKPTEKLSGDAIDTTVTKWDIFLEDFRLTADDLRHLLGDISVTGSDEISKSLPEE